MPLKLDTGKESLEMFFKDWQVEALRYLWTVQPQGANSRAVWTNVNHRLQGSISRASLINHLIAMVDDDLLTSTEAISKKDHGVYYMKHGEVSSNNTSQT